MPDLNAGRRRRPFRKVLFPAAVLGQPKCQWRGNIIRKIVCPIVMSSLEKNYFENNLLEE